MTLRPLLPFTLLLACAAPPDEPPDAASPDAPDAGTEPELVLAWTEIAGTPEDLVRWGTVLTYDPVDRQFLLFGGNTYDEAPGEILSDTWSFDLATGAWREFVTTGHPPARYCHCAAYLPTTREVLVAGGRDRSGTVNSAWTVSLTTGAWQQVSGPVPVDGIGCAATWMPGLGRAIVFGGEGMGGLSNDTWSYDPTARAFTKLDLDVAPPGRRDPMSFFDPGSGRFFVFGGATSVMQRTHLDDLWAFDGTAWTEVTPDDPRPSPRRYAAGGWDALHGRGYLFGGTNELVDFDEVWRWDPQGGFTLETVADGPAPRSFAASGIEEETGALYLFGGFTPQYEGRRDGWKLALEPKE